MGSHSDPDDRTSSPTESYVGARRDSETRADAKWKGGQVGREPQGHPDGWASRGEDGNR